VRAGHGGALGLPRRLRRHRRELCCVLGGGGGEGRLELGDARVGGGGRCGGGGADGRLELADAGPKQASTTTARSPTRSTFTAIHEQQQPELNLPAEGFSLSLKGRSPTQAGTAPSEVVGERSIIMQADAPDAAREER